MACTMLIGAVGHPGSAQAATVEASQSTSAPSAPSGVSATAGEPTSGDAFTGNGTAEVSWVAPADDGGSPISSYRVLARPTHQTLCGCPGDQAFAKDVTTGTSTTLTGLHEGVEYAITVTATNAVGTSPESSPPIDVLPRRAAPPGAPANVQATPADQAANISWAAPTDEGSSSVTSYTVTASPATAEPITTQVSGATSTQLTGLTNGTQYAITVAATNSVGTGPASSPAVNVTPTSAVATGLSLATSTSRTTAGQTYSISGRLVGGDVVGKSIEVQRSIQGEAPSMSVLTTDADGAFSATVTARYSTSFTARFEGSPTQQAATSPARQVTVATRITVQHPLANNTRTSGTTLTVTGSISPVVNGALVVLAVRNAGGGGNTPIARGHVNSAGNFTLTKSLPPGVWLLQVTMSATTRNGSGASRLFRIYQS